MQLRDSISTVLYGALLAGTVQTGLAADSTIDLDAAPLNHALMNFATLCGITITVPADLARNQISEPLKGERCGELALQRLLHGSGLSYKKAPGGGIAIVAVPTVLKTAALSPAPRPLAAVSIAVAAQAANAAQAPVLEEVTVTAGKRGEERLQDVPVSITAFDQAMIQQAGMDNFLDYARNVPGVGFKITSPAGGRDDLRGGRRVNIRGIESGFDSVPTTAFYLDEAPVPVMDPKLFDVERIEVLRGPQGTLYGANSMGGTIRVVLNKPRLNDYFYEGDVTASATAHGDTGYRVNSMVNAPLVDDKVALRGVMFYRDEGGYIDNVLSLQPSTSRVDVQKDINTERSWGARLAATIQPNEQLTITPSVFRQETTIQGTPTYLKSMGDLKLLARDIPEEQTNNFTLSAVDVKYDFGNGFELFSSTAYFESVSLITEDLTYGNTAYYGPLPDGSPRTTWAFTEIEHQRFSEEIRLSYRGDRWNGVIGAFFLDEQRDFWQDFPIGALRDIYPDTESMFTGTQNNDEQQVAVFSEVSVSLTDKLRVTAGARWFDGKQKQLTNYDNHPESGKGSDSAVSPKLQVDYHVNDDHMVYLSGAKGFRPGGANNIVPLDDLACVDGLARLGLTRAPTDFDADELTSYEFGWKAELAERRVRLNTSAYFIDWKDVQKTVQMLNCGFSFIGNIGAAESRGGEIEFAATPMTGLDLTATVGYTDAKYTESSDEAGVVKGDPFPIVPKTTASIGVQYRFDIMNGRSAHVRADAQYVDESRSDFYSYEGLPVIQPSYELVNFRFGMELTERLSVVLSVDNVLDERPALDMIDIGPPYGYLMSTSRPRQYGLTFRYSGR
ncbi:TonB-dependent receptor [Steroidobacter sp.]|uniref:TonB-dependent receptor n=1 Tax=Steroidobacter sp. TaxID=1978227 RepID=UPI001A3F363B|nr:TonB-dependent receptor [Steroidobacter sp.]MBL8269519.1 TonB-dependent receptor [Steroidobacter sp.]